MLVTGSRILVVEDVSRTQGRSVVVVGRASSRPSLRQCPTDSNFWLGCVTSSGFATRAPSLFSLGLRAHQQHSQSLLTIIVKYNVHTNRYIVHRLNSASKGVLSPFAKGENASFGAWRAEHVEQIESYRPWPDLATRHISIAQHAARESR